MTDQWPHLQFWLHCHSLTQFFQFLTFGSWKWHRSRWNTDNPISTGVIFVRWLSRRWQWHSAKTSAWLPLDYGCYSSWQLSKKKLFTSIKFKTFQDYFVKFKYFKALNLVQSNSKLFRTFKAPCRPRLTFHWVGGIIVATYYPNKISCDDFQHAVRQGKSSSLQHYKFNSGLWLPRRATPAWNIHARTHARTQACTHARTHARLYNSY